MDIIWEVPLTNTDVRNFYARELKEEGWEPPEGIEPNAPPIVMPPKQQPGIPQ